MHIHPVGQCDARMPLNILDTEPLKTQPRQAVPTGDPLVALFDGLPLTGHQRLRGRLIIDDPDSFESAYQAQDRFHGTTMASLICHGELNQGSTPIQRPIYSRPIMKPKRDFTGQLTEAIPDDVLAVDLIHRATRRLYESENGDPPAAPSVLVINLSVCNRYLPFSRGVTSLARLVDWLAWKYQVLFIVSAGNHLHDLALDIPRSRLRQLTADERELAVVKALAADTRNRRLLSPAETLNGLTVAATPEDASSPSQSQLLNPFVRTAFTSVYSAHGPGYRRAVKPDVLLPGGRQFLTEKIGTSHSNAILQTNPTFGPPGQLVAAPGMAGQLDQTVHTRGTSNAAALSSRWAHLLHDLIEQLRDEPDTYLPEKFDAVLLKALLVHGADWSDAKTLYAPALKSGQTIRSVPEHLGKFLGYGTADPAKVMTCAAHRVTVLGFGELDDGHGAEFMLPMPPSLSAVHERRRLTITLAWFSPINSARQNYRIAQLWFNPKNDLAPDRVCADHHAVQRGTVQHEVLEGDGATAFQDGDSLAIKINCRADAGDIPESIRYGLAVTLEVAEGTGISIYQEVRDRLAVRVPVQSVNPA